MDANVSMSSSRPYLVRAFYEWIVDNNLTPYLLISAEQEGVMVPKQYIKDGKIVFNIAPEIVQALNISNYAVEFSARFSGAVKQIYAPMNAVLAIYARENGRGMVFSEADDDETGKGQPPTTPTPSEPPKKGRPKLTVVK